MHDVVITGIGPILPNCDNSQTFWEQISNGQSQLSFASDPARAGETIAMGRIHDFDPRTYLKDVPERYYRRFARSHLLYLASLFQACAEAGLDRGVLKSDRAGLFAGTSRDNLDVWCEYIGHEEMKLTREHVGMANSGMGVGLAAAILGLRGPTYTFSNTCASGAVAVGHALRELQTGEVDIALASGYDAALLPPVYELYRNSGLLSLERDDPRIAIRPYGGNSKNAFGEGAMTLVLETREHAEARSARIIAAVTGYAYGNSGQHPTNLDPTGTPAANLIRRVLARHGMSDEQVGFVFGHGNGVDTSDASEVAYMRAVFGKSGTPLISIKPIYGHILGASATVNLAAAAMVLYHQFLVPTINVTPEKLTGVDHQPNLGKARKCEAGLVVCYGMGGQNAILLATKAHESHEHTYDRTNWQSLRA